jgi:hypothetical protein
MSAGIAFMLAGAAIFNMTRCQPAVAFSSTEASSTEAEFAAAAADSGKAALCLRSILLWELGVEQLLPRPTSDQRPTTCPAHLQC